MPAELTKDERSEIYRRAQALHRRFDLGGAYSLGDLVVDCIPHEGVWVYEYSRVVYSHSLVNDYAIYSDPSAARRILAALRGAMILDDLANA